MELSKSFHHALENPLDRLFWIGEEPYHLSALGQRKYYALYLARSLLQSQHSCLIKWILPKWSSYQPIREKLLDESAWIRLFDAPGFPHWIANGFDTEIFYLCYSHPYPSKSLASYLTQPDLFPQDSRRSIGLNIMAQLTERLLYLHGRLTPLIHGDIHLHNAFLDEQEKVHLMDFSCMRPLYRQNMHWLGHPAYLSPEQAQGKYWERPSDIYQLGILSYEWFTGQRWNRGKTSKTQKQWAAQANTPTRDFLVAQGLSLGLSSLIASMLNTQPQQRPSAYWLYQKIKEYC